ncbi:hypothetical protein JW921_10180 [Candidatus Fermentibacterales bacterium]|nr:hypothetical protein [Candidatus Fermentibacterales bacterium]
MGWLADKMMKWEASIDRRAGSGAGCRVTRGWTDLRDDLARIAEWSLQAQRRLSTEVPDEQPRCEIMLERSCVFTEEFGDTDIVAMRDLYRETGSPETVLEAMRENPDRFGDPFVDGDAIIEIRRPRDPEAFSAATTPRERQIAACYCPLVRETRAPFPLEYCCCSAGWYKGVYEGIFGAPAEVRVEESILSGSMICRFSIRIPGVLGEHGS